MSFWRGWGRTSVLQVNKYGVYMYIIPYLKGNFSVGWTHGAPYRSYGYVPLRFGGTLLGEWEHNNNKEISVMLCHPFMLCLGSVTKICWQWQSMNNLTKQSQQQPRIWLWIIMASSNRNFWKDKPWLISFLIVGVSLFGSHGNCLTSILPIATDTVELDKVSHKFFLCNKIWSPKSSNTGHTQGLTNPLSGCPGQVKNFTGQVKKFHTCPEKCINYIGRTTEFQGFLAEAICRTSRSDLDLSSSAYLVICLCHRPKSSASLCHIRHNVPHYRALFYHNI